MTIKKLFAPILFSFSLSAPLIQAYEPLDRIVAVVDDGVILKSELDAKLVSVKRQLKKSQTPSDQVLKSQVLDRLILDSIQLQMAQKAGVRVSDNLLNQTMERVAKQNKMSLTEFKAALKKDGIPYSEAREQIRQEMIISQVHKGRVGARINVSDKEIDNFLSSGIGKAQTSAEYRLGHILVAMPSKPSPEELKSAQQKIKSIYNQLKKGADFKKLAVSNSDSPSALKGGDLGWRKELELPSLFADVAPRLPLNGVSDPIRNASGFHIVKLLEKRGGSSVMVPQTHVRHILIQTNEIRDEAQAKTFIHQLRKRIQNGEPFEAIANQYTDDPGSSVNGGDLGWVSPGDMVPVFEEMMKNTPVNQISRPFLTQFGWHILEVMEHRDQDMGEQFQRNQAKHYIFNRKFEEELPIWLNEIKAEAFVEIKDL